MTKVISSFANTTGDLKSLDDEYVGLVRFFNKPEIKTKVDFDPHLNEELGDLTSTILDAKKELRVFHFSGHSQQSGLDFPEAEFDSGHVIHFFNTLNQEENNLQCVFINGCENAGIIQKLDHVPVVIGTRSKIQDSVAQKFTLDFFSSLIAGESSYRQAFLDAVAAQKLPDYKVFEPLRGEGAAAQLRKGETLNQYYMVVNDDEVANSKFPFRKKPANFARFIFIFLLLVALVLGFLYRDQLIGLVRGYTCPEWIDDQKCRLLVADFNSETDADVNELIAEGIDSNEEINPYMEAQYAAEFKEFTGQSSKGEDLHKLCNYDFTLTGGILKRQSGQYKMDLVLFSDFPDFQDEESQVMEIGDLVELEEMVQTVNLDNSDHFLINRICIACAQKREELIPVIEKRMKEYKKTMTSAESYQNLNMEMFALHKQRGDSEKMLTVLSNIASVGKNDYVLGALERSVTLNQKLDMVMEAFENQSRYIEEAEMRIRRPAAFKTTRPKQAYRQNQLKMRLARGNHVLRHPDELRAYLGEALTDFRILQENQYRNRNYAAEIKRLEDLIGAAGQTGREDNVEVVGRVTDDGGSPVSGVLVRLNQVTVETDTRGRFNLGTMPREDVVGRMMILERDGYRPGRFRIRDIEDLEQLRMQRIEEDPERRLYTFKGLVRECGQEGTFLKEILIDGKSVPLEKGVYYTRMEAEPGSQLEINLPTGYAFAAGGKKQVELGENPLFDETLDVVSEERRLRVFGRVVTKGDPIAGAKVEIAGKRVGTETNTKGEFSLTAEINTCAEIVVHAGGYQDKVILVKDFFRGGRRVLVGDIDLPPARAEIPEDRKETTEVVLQTIHLSGREFNVITKAIEEAGFKLSDNSRNFDRAPAGIPKESRIQYVHDHYAGDAKVLASLMEKVTNKKFGISKYSASTRLTNARTRQKLNLILVQYIPDRRID